MIKEGGLIKILNTSDKSKKKQLRRSLKTFIIYGIIYNFTKLKNNINDKYKQTLTKSRF